ncbi:unnamed protein product [Prorocentrum cordatum]|uniref:Uncharacterized protein n=1 Tax=Prorocentrum cordatum TaxID=2364126 RepID=A0ABN9SG57_9DINO|nr:unnamed protein product [Polarella glacialis]
MADVLGRRRLWGARPRNPRGPRIFCVHGASLPPSTFPAVRGRTPQVQAKGTAVLHPVPDNARSAAHACARLHLEHVCVPSTLEFEWQGGCGPPLYWSYGGRPRCPVTPVLLLPLLLLSLLLMASKSVTAPETVALVQFYLPLSSPWCCRSPSSIPRAASRSASAAFGAEEAEQTHTCRSSARIPRIEVKGGGVLCTTMKQRFSTPPFSLEGTGKLVGVCLCVRFLLP